MYSIVEDCDTHDFNPHQVLNKKNASPDHFATSLKYNCDHCDQVIYC